MNLSADEAELWSNRLDKVLKKRAALTARRNNFVLQFERNPTQNEFWWRASNVITTSGDRAHLVGLLQFTFRASVTFCATCMEGVAEAVAIEFSRRSWRVEKGLITTHIMKATRLPGRKPAITIVDGSFEFSYPATS